jgi:hypothetical protein
MRIVRRAEQEESQRKGRWQIRCSGLRECVRPECSRSGRGVLFPRNETLQDGGAGGGGRVVVNGSAGGDTPCSRTGVGRRKKKKRCGCLFLNEWHDLSQRSLGQCIHTPRRGPLQGVSDKGEENAAGAKGTRGYEQN